MKFISWNCRGLGHPSKIAALKDLTAHEKPRIVMIQETKQRLQEMTRIIEQLRHYEGQICEARGASGGIFTMWTKNTWKCTSKTINPYWIKVTLEKQAKDKQIVIYNIYAPNHFRDKDQCWATLQEDIQTEDNRNIIFGGDLNLILHSKEKRGGFFTHDPYREKLENIMQERDLVDIIPKKIREGSLGFIWECKLKNTKNALKEWVKQHYKEPENVKAEIKNKLKETHRKIEENGLSQEDKALESDIYYQLYRVNREEEQKWRIKSRQLWLHGGDKNTAFFHKQATVRKVGNNVTMINDEEGCPQKSQEAIKQIASAYYNTPLTETKETKDYSDLLQHMPKGINEDINANLTKEINEEEIHDAIWALQPDKAPGPDGFPICFYRTYWGIIKKYLVKILRWVQRKWKIGGFTNATHLALIPKEIDL
eukprot:PITA_05552